MNNRKGFTLIELLIAVAIIGILILATLSLYRLQLLKGRDARRKADLVKIQKVLEDYLNDHICYPESLECGSDFSPYLSSVPCDPVNVNNNIYFYSISQDTNCKKWYKIFTTLEYDKDPIIKKIGCTPEFCGPYNYLVSSPNVESLKRQLGEIYPWGEPSPTPIPTLVPTNTSVPTRTNTPTPTPIIPSCPGGWFTCIGEQGHCNISYEGAPGAVCSSTCNNCKAISCSDPTCY